ncbi:MAG: DUF4176 domain-containing protein [Bacilli bacterium]|nr:DUF4176 domain-containing protein [Bacilli bacterium]
MKDKYLPIGSVVKLKRSDKRVFITSFLVKENDSDKIYDYSGFTYPEGMTDPQKVILFNNKDIDKVDFNGYEDKEWKEYSLELGEVKAKNQNDTFIDVLE